MINRETFEAWLFSQPKERTFVFVDNTDCLICKFFKECTPYKSPHVSTYYYSLNGLFETIQIEHWLTLLMDNRAHGLSLYPQDGVFTFGQMQDVYTHLYGNPNNVTTEEFTANNTKAAVNVRKQNKTKNRKHTYARRNDKR